MFFKKKPPPEKKQQTRNTWVHPSTKIEDSGWRRDKSNPKVYIVHQKYSRPNWHPTNEDAEYEALDIKDRVAHGRIWSYGLRLLKAGETPKSLTIEKKNTPNQIADIFASSNHLTLVSSRMRDLMTKFDPDLHQYVPVELFYKDGNPVEKDWYILNITARKQSIILPLSDVRVTSHASVSFRQTQNIALFSPKAIDGVHVWRENSMTNDLFISEDFYKAVKDAGMKFLPTWVGEVVSGSKGQD